MSVRINIEKMDAVPAEPGPPVEVGECSCGGKITKQYVRPLFLQGKLRGHRWNITCTKGGDACLKEIW
jgi:hypothetical protein